MTAREAKVNVAPGDVDRTCASCGELDEHPRFVILGVRTEQQQVTLKDGRQVTVNVPVDVAYHHDCLAAMGCHLSQELLAVNDGTLRGKDATSIVVPDHLVEIEPHEFTHDERGVYTRVRSKAEAAAHRIAEHEAGA